MSFYDDVELVPIIPIDPKVEHNIIFRDLYYRPEGYYRTVEKLYDACKKVGYNFSLTDIKNWLNKQAIFQIHAPRPRNIPYASFNNIMIPMEVIQADILYMPFDK